MCNGLVLVAVQKNMPLPIAMFLTDILRCRPSRFVLFLFFFLFFLHCTHFTCVFYFDYDRARSVTFLFFSHALSNFRASFIIFYLNIGNIAYHCCSSVTASGSNMFFSFVFIDFCYYSFLSLLVVNELLLRVVYSMISFPNILLSYVALPKPLQGKG